MRKSIYDVRPLREVADFNGKDTLIAVKFRNLTVGRSRNLIVRNLIELFVLDDSLQKAVYDKIDNSHFNETFESTLKKY